MQGSDKCFQTIDTSLQLDNPEIKYRNHQHQEKN